MGGKMGQGVFAIGTTAKIHSLEAALLAQPNTAPGKSTPGTGRFTRAAVWSRSDLLADKWIMRVGIKL